jgi:hypothetical protein
MATSVRTRNRLALALLIVGKLFGIAGLAIAGSHRTAGGLLLALDGLLIVSAIVVSLRTMKRHAVQDEGDKELLRKMIREGTLQQHLRDLEAEGASDASASSSTHPPA